MSIFSFLYHLLIFVVGVFISTLFTLVLIYVFTSNVSNDQTESLLFPSEPEKPAILTLPVDNRSTPGIWMFASLVTQLRLTSRIHLQAVYVKLSHPYLLIHLTSKGVKHLHRTPIAFSQVLIFDLLQSKVSLKPFEQYRRQYWSKKTPLVLSQLRYLACYQILKNKKRKKEHADDDDTTFFNYLRPMKFSWLTTKVREPRWFRSCCSFVPKTRNFPVGFEMSSGMDLRPACVIFHDWLELLLCSQLNKGKMTSMS